MRRTAFERLGDAVAAPWVEGAYLAFSAWIFSHFFPILSMAFSTCFDFEAVACCTARKKVDTKVVESKGGELVVAEGQLPLADLPDAYLGSAWIAEFEPGLLMV